MELAGNVGDGGEATSTLHKATAHEKTFFS